MRQAWHIFKKDTRHLWREICLMLGLAAIFAWLNPWWMPTLLMAAASFMIARLVHAEAIPGDRQFWITRPYRWRSLLAAKLLFMVAFVNLPLSLAQLYGLADGALPPSAYLPGLLWSQVLVTLLGTLPAFALAAMTPGLAAFVFPALLVLTIWFGAAVGQPIGLQTSWPYGVEWMRDAIAVTALAAVLTTILYVQYRGRRTWLGRGIAAGGTAAVAAMYFWLPWAPAWALESRLSKKALDRSAVRIFSDPNAVKFSRMHSRTWDNVRVVLPISAGAVPDGVDIKTDALVVTFQGSDGKTTKAASAGAIWRSSGSGAADTEAFTSLDAAFYDQEHDKPVTMRGSLYLTVFGNARAKTIPIRSTPLLVMDGVQCYSWTGAEGFSCSSAFRWPDRRVYANMSPLTELISYSPFPAGAALDPWVSHWTPFLLRSAREVTIRVEEPLAHIRRDFELRIVRLAVTAEN